MPRARACAGPSLLLGRKWRRGRAWRRLSVGSARGEAAQGSRGFCRDRAELSAIEEQVRVGGRREEKAEGEIGGDRGSMAAGEG